MKGHRVEDLRHLPFVSLGLRQRTNSRPTAAAGRDFDVVTTDGATDIFHMKEYFNSVTHPGAAIASAASGRISPVHYHHSCNECYMSERSFSALLKSYLRTTTLQEHLNYLMLLDVHKKRTESDVLDMQAVVTEFIGESEHRCGIFAAYI